MFILTVGPHDKAGGGRVLMRQSVVEPLNVRVFSRLSLLQIIQLDQNLLLLDLVKTLAFVNIFLDRRRGSFEESEGLCQIGPCRQVSMAGDHLRILSQVRQYILIRGNRPLGTACTIGVHVPTRVPCAGIVEAEVISKLGHLRFRVNIDGVGVRMARWNMDTVNLPPRSCAALSRDQT
jgi:hypothetical protein